MALKPLDVSTQRDFRAMTVSLCVVFNHPYPANIEVLKRMYENRFDNVIFVQPFLGSARDDVIVSHRGSFNFQGLIFDAVSAIEKIESDFVVFTQDDCIINPFLTKENIISELNVSADRPYFGNFKSISGPIDGWQWTLPTIWRSFYGGSSLICTGVEDFIKYLPDANAARRHLETFHNIHFLPITLPTTERWRHGAVSEEVADVAITRALVDGLFKTASSAGIEINYPWLYGMSDFSVMSIKSLNKIKQFLGVTAAVSLFAEVAIPTALAISHEEISSPINNKWNPEYIWGSDRENADIGAIERAFGNNVVVIHPIKISRNRHIAEELYGISDH